MSSCPRHSAGIHVFRPTEKAMDARARPSAAPSMTWQKVRSNRRRCSKIAAAAVHFPIAVARGLRAFGAADFLWPLGRCFRRRGRFLVGGGRLLLFAHDGHIAVGGSRDKRSEEHTSELQSLAYLVCRLLLEKKKK